MPRSLREQLILKVAGQVFAQGGYDRASMDRIAELAGVSKPMLYAYFGSKEGLYVAYIERTGAELVQRLVRADGEQPEPRRLRSVIDEFLAFVEEHRDGWTVLFRELNSSLPLAAQVASLRAEIVSEVRHMLESDGERHARPAGSSGLRGGRRGDRGRRRGAGQLVAEEVRRAPRGRRGLVRRPRPGRHLQRLRALSGDRGVAQSTPGKAPPSISRLWPVM